MGPPRHFAAQNATPPQEGNYSPPVEGVGGGHSPPVEEQGWSNDLMPSADPIYILVNEDESLTISSSDTAALDKLETFLQQLNDGIVYEGRDFTIFAIRNTSANAVWQRLSWALRDKIARGLQQQQQRFAFATPTTIPLNIQADITTNTIQVHGSRVDRREVAKLIALFDVSQLPGENIVTKPVSVPIQNTSAVRIQQEIYQVYRQKIAMTQLPGGVVPQVLVNNTRNSLEIIAPEPLASELKEYAEEIDRKMLEEPGRQVHVIPLKVKWSVLQQALQQTQQPFGIMMSPYGYGMVQPYGYGGGMMVQPFGGMRRTFP